MFKIIKKDNIPVLLETLLDMYRDDWIESNEIILDEDIDEKLIHTRLELEDYDEQLCDNELKNILKIVKDLNSNIDLGYNQSEYAYNLINLEDFIDELSKNNIKLVDYKFNWFVEAWYDHVCIILYKQNELIFFRS